jgi:hypothetical protein
MDLLERIRFRETDTLQNGNSRKKPHPSNEIDLSRLFASKSTSVQLEQMDLRPVSIAVRLNEIGLKALSLLCGKFFGGIRIEKT